MIGKIIEGKYRIIAELGKGGMGALYLAEHTALPKRFAIKRLLPELTQSPEFRGRFYQEATHQAQLSHPNIVQAIDFLEEDGQFFFVMEYIDGQDLGKLIKTKGKLSEKEALSIFKNVLEGFKFAHNKAIIHRDIKPSNILIDESGIARITDFGIAILAGERRLTATGNVVGSPWYMSPEQIVHPQAIDRRSDIYSAGIVLYEMLTGDVPFDGETDYSIKNQQVSSPVPNPCQQNPAISQQLGQMILTAMAKEPDKRFQDCAGFLAAIEAYERTRIVPSKKPSWFFILLWSLVAIGLAGVGTFMVQHLAQDQKNIPPPGLGQELARQEAERKAEAEYKARLEAEYKARLEAEHKAKLEAEHKAAAEQQAQQQAQQVATLAAALAAAQVAAREQQARQEVERAQQAADLAAAQVAAREQQARQEAERAQQAAAQMAAREQQARQEALDLVRSYYQDMNRRDCSSASQKRIKPPGNLCSLIEQTELTRLDKIELERIDQNSAIVNIDVIVKSYSSPSEKWVGSIPLQRVGGSWKIITTKYLKRQ